MARSANDLDKKYIYFMGSQTLPSACYILSVECSIPFTLRITGIKKQEFHKLTTPRSPIIVEKWPWNWRVKIIERKLKQ